ncbi:hypothetical protein Tco_0039360 [Tanacetum coccineum]
MLLKRLVSERRDRWRMVRQMFDGVKRGLRMRRIGGPRWKIFERVKERTRRSGVVKSSLGEKPSDAIGEVGDVSRGVEDRAIYTQIDIDHAAGGNLRVLSAEEAWETIKDCARCDKHWKNPTSTIPDQTIANLKTQLVENEVVYTPPVTHPKDVEETIRTPIEVEPLNETKLEEVGLNGNHNTLLSSREVPSFDGPKPQPLLNSPSLDVSLGDVIGPEPPIKPHSPDSSKMKVVDYLTTQTPPSSLVASFHLRDLYCYYRPCINDPKKPYGFKPGLLGHSGSLGVDFPKLWMIEDDWKLESKEVSFLGRGLNSPVRPKEVEKVRIKETH